ncbi:hypothetical protein OF83DRAFT_1139680 [Amylostereum chailletii]|nr:hypothetical protein OF83DRAFT_1139680 [Amylostereum chailletii]
MAKSMRSKVKRSFRAKKREEGVYAASEAARLQRLNAKLVALTEEEAPKQEEGSEDGDDIAGWCWFACFGLLDPQDVDPGTMELFSSCAPFASASHHGRSLRRSEPSDVQHTR